MYYELNIIDKPKWINHIIRTTNKDDVVVFQVDFKAKYLTHVYGSVDKIKDMKHEIYVFRTTETINALTDGQCVINIKTAHNVKILTEGSKYGLTIALFSDMCEELVVYSTKE